jgi:hypothetical protein
MIEAPIWTVGPSRPTDAPLASAASVKPSFPRAMRIESSRSHASRFEVERAAIVCGMPLPCVPRKTCCVGHETSARPKGGANHDHRDVRWAAQWKNDKAASLPRAKATAVAPVATAPPQKTRARNQGPGRSQRRSLRVESGLLSVTRLSAGFAYPGESDSSYQGPSGCVRRNSAAGIEVTWVPRKSRIHHNVDLLMYRFMDLHYIYKIIPKHGSTSCAPKGSGGLQHALTACGDIRS